MTDGSAPRPAGPAPVHQAPVRGAPLLITAELPRDVFAWADGLRRAHYPPERNRLGAHVTLFHGLPPSAKADIRRLLGRTAARSAPEARISGVMDLGHGTALSVESEAMIAVHAELAERLHGLIQQKDARPLRLHITIQDKVSHAEARALQADLPCRLRPVRFAFRGLLLSHWRDALWRPAQLYRFRGQP